MSQFKNLTIIIVLVLLMSGCVAKTKVYKKQSDNVDIILTTKTSDKYLFLGEKYQYLFVDPKEVSKIKEILNIAKNAIHYEIGKNLYINVDKNGLTTFHLYMNLKPADKQLLTIVKSGFKQYKKGDNNTNGTWWKSYDIKGLISLKSPIFAHKYKYHELKDVYKINISFLDDYKIKKSLELPLNRTGKGLLLLFCLVVLL